ncbi:MAG: PTS sugar transporter subunit IIB [Gemmatimonadota bacterium]
MAIVLIRVDERLIHGQVVVGWGGFLGAQRYAVVDDDLAGSRWEQELYELALPEETTLAFVDRDHAGPLLAEWSGQPEPAVVLTRDLSTVRALVERGDLAGEAVNLGGLHAAPGRRTVLPYLHLSETQVSDLAWLLEHGVDVYAQDVPGGSRVRGDALLRKGKAAWTR